MYWFIFNHFLSVRKWDPKFIASNAQLTYSAIWIKLPELPTEFYDLEILQRVGSKIDTLLKADTCTSAMTRGRYARIFIELPFEKPLTTHVFIGMYRQQILYEGFNLLCTKCGRLGHTTNRCPFVITQNTTNPPSAPNNPINTPSFTSPSTLPILDSSQSKQIDGDWKTVQFPHKSRIRSPPRRWDALFLPWSANKPLHNEHLPNQATAAVPVDPTDKSSTSSTPNPNKLPTRNVYNTHPNFFIHSTLDLLHDIEDETMLESNVTTMSPVVNGPTPNRNPSPTPIPPITSTPLELPTDPPTNSQKKNSSPSTSKHQKVHTSHMAAQLTPQPTAAMQHSPQLHQ